MPGALLSNDAAEIPDCSRRTLTIKGMDHTPVGFNPTAKGLKHANRPGTIANGPDASTDHGTQVPQRHQAWKKPFLEVEAALQADLANETGQSVAGQWFLLAEVMSAGIPE
jgi:hypothetical protein